MALTAAQICTLAGQTAKVPGFTSQAGQLLNMILRDLCQNYDFDVAKKTYNFNFDVALGSGPQPLPADYLRVSIGGSMGPQIPEFFYTIQGVPYFMTPTDLAEFDSEVQTSGVADFPREFATDFEATPPNAYFYPPPSGAYAVTLRYFAQMAEITTPETSAIAPWFPNSTYLLRRLSGELMQLADDDRAESFLSDDEEHHPLGAGVILRKYLQMKDDKSSRGQTVKLDRRRFGGGDFKSLPNTKLVGW